MAAIPSNPAAKRPSRRDAMRGRARDWGWRRAVYWEIMHALARAVGLHVNLVVIAADRPETVDDHRAVTPAGYVVRWGTKADLQPFVGRIPGLDQAFLDESFDQGDNCTVAFHGDEVVGLSFSSRTWAQVTGQLRLEVPPGFRYGYKAWTHPAHRRRNLTNACQHLRRISRKFPYEERSFGYVETHNYASLLRGYRHPNERSVRFGYIGWITLFGREIPFRTRHAARLGVRIARRPVAHAG